jgi:hypothetical protein
MQIDVFKLLAGARWPAEATDLLDDVTAALPPAPDAVRRVAALTDRNGWPEPRPAAPPATVPASEPAKPAAPASFRSAREEWDALVAAKVKAGATPRAAAAALAREQPDLRRRVVEEATAERDRRREVARAEAAAWRAARRSRR